MIIAIVLAFTFLFSHDFQPTPIPIATHNAINRTLAVPHFQIYTGQDPLPKGRFPLMGVDPNGGPYKNLDPRTDLLELPFVHLNHDGTMTIGVVYKSPVNGICGVMANKDHGPDASDEKSLLYYGTFHVREGEYHLAAGSIDGFIDHQTDNQKHYYVFYIACLRRYATPKGEDFLKTPVMSRRYVLEVEPNT
jgi:hypothetical protein